MCLSKPLYLIFSSGFPLFFSQVHSFSFSVQPIFWNFPKYYARKQLSIFYLLPWQELKEKEGICPEKEKASLSPACKLPLILYFFALNITRHSEVNFWYSMSYSEVEVTGELAFCSSAAPVEIFVPELWKGPFSMLSWSQVKLLLLIIIIIIGLANIYRVLYARNRSKCFNFCKSHNTMR